MRGRRSFRARAVVAGRGVVVLYYSAREEFRASAFKHGVCEESIVHAIQFFLFRDDDMIGTEPPKVLILGPDGAGNILEVVAVIDEDGGLVVFHAMPARTAYLRLLE